MGISLTEKGFTLVEALIAILILSIGVLVVGTMQLTSIKANASASARSEAHAVVLSFVEVLQQIPFDADVLADGEHDVLTDDFENNQFLEHLSPAYTITDDSEHPLQDGQGRQYMVAWTVTDQDIGSTEGQVKLIKLSVTWDTQRGSGSSHITTVKYKNIDLTI